MKPITILFLPFIAHTASCVYIAPPPPKTILSDANSLHGTIECKGASGSPLSSDVTKVISDAKGHGGNCWSNNRLGSTCKSQYKSKTAELAICGQSDQFTCELLGEIAGFIQDKCKADRMVDKISQEVVGGLYRIDDKTKVILAHA